MPACDLCGREAGDLVRAEIEGTELNVCEECGKFGFILGEVEKEEKEEKRTVLPKKRIMPEEEVEERVVSAYAEKIRRAREKRRMDQEEFAKFLNEKESTARKWEGGNLRPGIESARKLERILGIDLIEKVEEKKIELKETKSGEITLGDTIRIRKRKG